ncbi:MAG TPA: hypothetical protein VHU40_17120, partial [Polyangia bacterium]|nr:hypothetical protein [Polyangia bacterium]
MSRNGERGRVGVMLALAVLVGGCGWRELQHDELFGADAGAPDAEAGVTMDADVDVNVDAATADVTADVAADVA